jgi:hypothetical protein
MLALCVLFATVSCSKTQSADKPAGVPASAGAAPSSASPAPPAAAPASAPAAAPGAGVETVPSPADPKQSIGGTITLPAARKGDVKKGDTIFLIARRAGAAPGPGSMLAVQRLQAGDFPMPFSLSNRDAMIPGTPFEGSIAITVRVDKDGDPITRRKGDVYGQASGIKVGSQDVTISLDTIQKEDVTLAGPMGADGQPMMPPGHPR